MNERLRLDYLDAMGIVQYAARFPLVGALPSPVVEYDKVEYDEVEPPATTSAQENIRKIFSEEKQPSTASKNPAETPATTLQKIVDLSKPENTVFHCQVVLWIVDDLLILAETPRMDNQQLFLLRNILKAIGRAEQLTNANQFSWPLSQHKDKGLAAARDHFQGMLDGGALKNSAVRQILCFGSNTTTLLSNDSQHTTTTEQYRDWPIIAVCALHDMLEQPAKKADTWRTLQVLVRA